MDYYSSMPQDACPVCHGTADVRTVQDLANMVSQAQGGPMPGPGPYPQPGYGPGQPGGYQAEPFYGPESGYGPRPAPIPGEQDHYEYGADSGDQEIADLVIGLAGRFIGKAIRNKMQKVAEQRVMPTLNARAQQQAQEMQAIAQRYPGLRGCMKDQVIFLAGGTRTVPLSEAAPNSITMAHADSIVARLQ